MAGIQIKFTITVESAAYLRWFAKNILLEDNEHDAARHLMLKQLEKTRRTYRKEEPDPKDLPPPPAKRGEE